MSDSYIELMTGIIARLKAVSAVTDLVGQRISSDTPQNTTFPYIIVTISSSPYDGKDFTGMEHDVQISAFGRKKTPGETGDIAVAVYDALNRQETNITLATHSVRNIQYSGVGFVEKEPDGVTWQSLRRFRCVVT